MDRTKLLTTILLTLIVVLTGITTTILAVKCVWEKSTTIHALAVSGNTGEVLNISITELEPGDGIVYIASLPLPAYGPGGEGQMFIASSQLAFYTASMLAWKPPFNYSFLIKVEGNIVEVGGPSASAYMTVAMFSLLTNSTMRQDMTMTGMILPGGLVGPVGDVPIKIEAAAKNGYKIVLVPLLNYLTLIGRRFPAKVIPVIDVEQAIQYFTGIQLVNNSLTISSILKSNKNITRTLKYIWETIYNAFKTLDLTKLTLKQEEQVFKLVEHAKEEAKLGNYYTAASLLYQAIVKYFEYLYINEYNNRARMYTPDIAIEYFNNIASKLKSEIEDIEYEISIEKPTIYTIDLLIGIYERILEAKNLLQEYHAELNSGSIAQALEALAIASARVLSLKTWLEVLKFVEKNYPSRIINSEVLRRVAEIYVQYCKALIGYSPLIRFIGGEVTPQIYVQKMITLYQEGRYVKVIALSFHYLSDITTGLISGFLQQIRQTITISKVSNILMKGADSLRESALTRTYELLKRGLLPIYSVMYIQFGNYYLKKVNTTNMFENIAMAYTDYILAKLHDDIIEFLYLSSINNITNIKFVKVQQNRQTTPTIVEVSSANIQINLPVIALSAAVFLAGILLVVVFVLLERRST